MLGSASPSLLSLLHSPSLEAQDLNGYFGQHGQWGDQPVGEQENPHPHIAWPPMDVDFCYPMQPQTEHRTNSANDETPRDDSSANGYTKLGRLSVSTTSNQALLTPPTSTTSTSCTTKSCPRRHKDSSSAPTTSPAEEIIRDTQELYRVGVKAGFLKQDDKVHHYLAAMRRVYQKVPSLMDDDYEGSSGATEDDEDEYDEEEEEEEEEMPRLKGSGRPCPCGKAH